MNPETPHLSPSTKHQAPSTKHDLPFPSVCHVVVSLDPGGLERLVVDWTNVRNRRHPGSTRICCLDAPGVLAPAVEGGEVHCLGARRARFPFDAVAVVRLRAILRHGEVVHSHNLAAQQYSALATPGTRIGHVHTEHGSNPHVRGIVNRLRHRLLAACTDRLVCVSRDTLVRMAAAWGPAARKGIVIPNGVSPHPRSLLSRAEWRAQFGIPLDARVIGSVGRLAEIKGYDRLVRILPALIEHEPSTHALLVGDGPARGDLEQLGRQCGVADRLHVAGFRADARELLDALDVFVLPSRSEGLSVALLEAMAAGLPAAVTDVGENAAVIAGGDAGVLLDADEARWAAALGALLVDPVLCERLATAAHERVTRLYSLDATLEAYEELYAGVVRR